MKPAILLSLLLTVSCKSFTQQKKIEGDYITSSGNTVKGCFPTFKQWDKNPSEVEFITTDNVTVILTPNNCLSFRIADYDSYIAYRGPRMINPIEDSKTETTDSTSQYDSINTFLRVIYQTNDIKIYSLKDKKRTNFFYQKGKDIIELEKKQFIRNAGNNKYISSIDRFKDQLKKEFSDQIIAKKLQFDINNLSYSEKKIVKFMDMVNETATSKKINKYPTQLFVGAGAALNSFSYKSPYTTDEENMIDYKSPIKPVLVIGANIYVSRNFGRTFISPRIKLYSYKSSGEVPITLSPSAAYTVKSTFGAGPIITILVNAGYLILKSDHLEWYISAGPNAIALLNNKEVREEIITAGQGPGSTAIREDNRFIFSVNAETGITIRKNWTAWLNYQPPIKAFEYTTSSIKFSSLQIGINWTFKVSK